MSETTTAIVIAGAAVVGLLLYEQMQQQQQIQNAILLKLATPAPAPSSDPLSSILKLAGPLLSFL